MCTRHLYMNMLLLPVCSKIIVFSAFAPRYCMRNDPINSAIFALFGLILPQKMSRCPFIFRQFKRTCTIQLNRVQ